MWNATSPTARRSTRDSQLSFTLSQYGNARFPQDKKPAGKGTVGGFEMMRARMSMIMTDGIRPRQVHFQSFPRQFLFAGPESIDSSARSPKQHDGGAQSKAEQHQWQAVWPYHHRFSHADSFDPSCAGSLLSSPLCSAIHRPRLRFSVFAPLPQGHSSIPENVQESGLSAAVRWQVSSTNSVDRRHGGGFTRSLHQFFRILGPSPPLRTDREVRGRATTRPRQQLQHLARIKCCWGSSGSGGSLRAWRTSGRIERLCSSLRRPGTSRPFARCWQVARCSPCLPARRTS